MLIELEEWYRALPPEFVPKYEETTQSYLPHVLQLHMQYHCIMIILTRPFLSSGKHSAVLDSGQVGQKRNKCLESARAMAQLLRMYRRTYTLRRTNVQAVHLVFTAALILVCSACGAPDAKEREESWPYLETCCQALGEMGQSFKNSNRAMEVITCIKAELLKQNRKNKKRSSHSVNQDDTSKGLRKKRRPTNSDEQDKFQQFTPLDLSSSTHPLSLSISMVPTSSRLIPCCGTTSTPSRRSS